MKAFTKVLCTSVASSIAAICAAVFVTSAGHARDSVGPLAIDHQDSMTLYVFTDCVGVVKSIDGGASWTAMNNGLPDDTVTALAIDPANRSTLYAATQLSGVFKSADAGASWTASNTGLTNPDLYAMAIDPITPSTLYAGTGTGVFKSIDGGMSWRAMNNGIVRLFEVMSLEIDPGSPQTLYALSLGGSVFRSIDGAASWTAMTAPATDAVLSLAIDPSDSQILYAGGAAPSGVFKSTDGGASWIAVINGLEGHVASLAIDPSDPQTVYAAAQVDLLKSTDGGASWTAMNNGLGRDLVNALEIDPNNPQTIYTRGGGDRGSEWFGSTDGARTWRVLAISSGCGDDLVATRCGEQCDDGNLQNGDGCDANCLVTACGNGIVTAGEQCDDGGLAPCDGCSDTCQVEVGFVCGDGLVNASCGEQCDDGNLHFCDGCSSTCQSELGFRCGDGTVNPTCGETCDDGNLQNGDGCDANCTPTTCGNGVVSAGEECDDANADPTDGCTGACTICGNQIVTPPEQCDEGHTSFSDGCTLACTRCGNVDGSEECADGNAVGGDGCAADCTVESTHSITLVGSRSGIGFQAKPFYASYPISGQLTLRVGKTRETGETPLAVRAEDLRIDPIRAAGVGCLCLSAIEDPALGDGVAGSGALSCDEPLAGLDVLSRVDHNTDDVDPTCEIGFLEDGSYPNHPHQAVCNGPEVVTTSGTGPPGSARLDVRMRGLTINDGGTCAVETFTRTCDANGCIPAKGADGIPCTEDDPVPGTSTTLRRQGSISADAAGVSFVSQAGPRPRSGTGCGQVLPFQFELRLTTNMAGAEIRDAGNALGEVIGKGETCGGRPCMTEAAGSALHCDDLASGAFAAAFVALDNSCFGDTVTTLVLGSCIGDCNDDGSVTVDELITGVNIALRDASLGGCPSLDTNGDDRVTVDELIAAVNAALNECG